MRTAGRTLCTLLLLTTAIAMSACDDGDTPSSPAAAGTLVFVRVLETAGDAQADFEIFRADANGSGARNLTRNAAAGDFDPAISPDGRLVAFWRIARVGDGGGDGAPAGLRIMNIDGTDVRPVGVGGTSPSWSPDGAELAFENDASGGPLRTAIWVTDVAGTVRSNASAQWPTPAGQQFVHDHDPDWSPDGAWIAFATDRGTVRQRIAIARVGGPELRYLTSPAADSVSDSEPKWSPDGRAVAFVRWTAHAVGSPTQDVWVTDLMGERNVTHGGVSVPLGHEWTPDGRLLVGDGAGIVRYRLDGTREAVIVSRGRSPSVRN